MYRKARPGILRFEGGIGVGTGIGELIKSISLP